MVANSTLMVLTIVSRKRYMRYALYHMLTFLFSMIQLILLFCGVLENKVLTIVASGIAGLSLLLTVILCGKAMWEETHVNRDLGTVFISRKGKKGTSLNPERNVSQIRRTLTMRNA